MGEKNADMDDNEAGESKSRGDNLTIALLQQRIEIGLNLQDIGVKWVDVKANTFPTLIRMQPKPCGTALGT